MKAQWNGLHHLKNTLKIMKWVTGMILKSFAGTSAIAGNCNEEVRIFKAANLDNDVYSSFMWGWIQAVKQQTVMTTVKTIR